MNTTYQTSMGGSVADAPLLKPGVLVEVRTRHYVVERWLEKVDQNIREEPEWIRSFYQIASNRPQPVGIMYLWPTE